MEKEQDIFIHLDHFDGPLALLLHLVHKDEYPIEKLDINTLTKQYLGYLNKMQDLNFDIAGDFLYMATTLVYLKSKYSLADEVNESLEQAPEDLMVESKAELIAKLEELAHMQQMSQKLWELPRLGESVFTRPKLNRKKVIDSMTAPMELTKLTESMIDYLIKTYRQYKVVRRDRISIKEKLRNLVRLLEPGIRSQFTELVDRSKGLDDIVITFISLLELARLKKIAIFQNEENREIYVDVLSALNDLDIESANGFDDEEVEKEKGVLQ